jgi:WD40-like Beta Propeller Repeat
MRWIGIFVVALAVPAMADSLPEPAVFAPGVISGPANDGAPTFTPDGHTLYFDRSNGRWTVIVESHRTKAGWSTPRIADFVDPGASDQQPALSPDGKSLVYVSVRLTPPGSATKVTGHLYKVTRTAKGWSAPVELPASVNVGPRVFKPSLAANGDLYFMADARPEMAQPPKWRLYRSVLKGGVYQAAEPLPFSDGSFGDVDPGVAPDGSYLVFSSAGRKPLDDGHEHMFIVFRKGDGWTAPQALRYAADNGGYDDGEANIAPDGRLYFTSGRQPPFDRKRTRAGMQADYRRMEQWDNSNNNVWSLPLKPYLAHRS